MVTPETAILLQLSTDGFAVINYYWYNLSNNDCYNTSNEAVGLKNSDHPQGSDIKKTEEGNESKEEYLMHSYKVKLSRFVQ